MAIHHPGIPRSPLYRAHLWVRLACVPIALITIAGLFPLARLSRGQLNMATSIYLCVTLIVFAAAVTAFGRAFVLGVDSRTRPYLVEESKTSLTTAVCLGMLCVLLGMATAVVALSQMRYTFPT